MGRLRQSWLLLLLLAEVVASSLAELSPKTEAAHLAERVHVANGTGGFELVHDAQPAVGCLSDDGSAEAATQLLMLVVSSATPAGFARRSLVRRTWGSRRSVPMVFLLGQPKDLEVQAGIDAEAGRYRDVVQLRVQEGRLTVTERHLAGLEWALARCPGARHLVRVVDTVFVDPFHLSAYLAEYPPPGILCSIRRNERPQRLPKYLWYVSEREFPGSVYPDLCDTVAYAIRTEAALKLLISASTKTPIWIDDVHVTGILRDAAGVPLTAFSKGHGLGSFVPSDSRAWGSASDHIFLRSDRPAFNGVYWPGMWRSLLLRECSNMIF